jgi:hypothetical protein
MTPDNQSSFSLAVRVQTDAIASRDRASVDTDFQTAQIAANICREWHRLKTEENLSGNQAAAALGKSPSWFSVNFPRWQRGGVAAFLPERRELGAARRIFTDLPGWFLVVARFFYLNTNLTSSRGSLPKISSPRDCFATMPARRSQTPDKSLPESWLEARDRRKTSNLPR